MSDLHVKYYVSGANKVVCNLVFLPFYSWPSNSVSLPVEEKSALLDYLADIRMQKLYKSSSDIISIGNVFSDEESRNDNLSQLRSEYLLNILQRKNTNERSSHYSLKLNYKGNYPKRKHLSFIVILKIDNRELDIADIKVCLSGVDFDYQYIDNQNLLSYDSSSVR